VLIEPNTPLSIDTARFSNLPVTALHDVLFIPSPRRRDLYEWARNDLTSLLPGAPPGMFGFRSILFDLGKPPFADLVKRFQDSSSAIQAANVDLVLEDVVIPASGFGFPLPTHGTFGIRRRITDRNDIEQAYSLSQAPFRVRLYSRSGQADADRTGLYLVVNQLEFRTGSLAADSDYPPVLEFQAQLDWQNQSDAEGAKGGSIGVSDDWVVQLGLALGADSPLHIMTIASAAIAINAVKGGLRLTTFGDDLDHSWQALVDISVRDTSTQMSGSAYPAFKITTLTGKPLNVILRVDRGARRSPARLRRRRPTHRRGARIRRRTSWWHVLLVQRRHRDRVGRRQADPAVEHARRQQRYGHGHPFPPAAVPHLRHPVGAAVEARRHPARHPLRVGLHRRVRLHHRRRQVGLPLPRVWLRRAGGVPAHDEQAQARRRVPQGHQH
jgi:hypothetical protein